MGAIISSVVASEFASLSVFMMPLSIYLENEYLNVQFDSSVVLDDHRHALKFVQNRNNKSLCSQCGKICSVFECNKCNFHLCTNTSCLEPTSDPMSTFSTEAGGGFGVGGGD
ncbi:hypothetical protein LguiB_004421 [Lonicera macranthoides]